jgi:hypothetical protein
VGRQRPVRYGKAGNGVVTVTTLWADERLCYPVHAVPYTPARHFAKGKGDPAFRTKLAIGASLAIRAPGPVPVAVAARRIGVMLEEGAVLAPAASSHIVTARQATMHDEGQFRTSSILHGREKVYGSIP